MPSFPSVSDKVEIVFSIDKQISSIWLKVNRLLRVDMFTRSDLQIYMTTFQSSAFSKNRWFTSSSAAWLYGTRLVNVEVAHTSTLKTK